MSATGRQPALAVRAAHAGKVPTAAVASGVAIAVTVAALLLTGVRVTELVLFVGYEIGFVLVPGMVLHAVLAGTGRPMLERLVLGYALGLVIELAAFTLTAALDVRGLLPLYPLPFYVGAGVAVATGRWSARIPDSRSPISGRLAWLSAGVAAMTAVWLTLGIFISNPLARAVDSVAYDQDVVFHLGLAAEARHQWPINDPNVAGDPLRYHTFAHRDLAAVSQVTGLPLDVLLLRLWPVALLLAIAGGLVLVTRRLGGSVGTGVLAVALVMFAGELDVSTKLLMPLIGGSLFAHAQNPGYILGVLFFLGALYVLLDCLRLAPVGSSTHDPPSQWRSFAMFALLLAGASGSKAPIVLVLGGGLGLLALGDLMTKRRLRRGTLPAAVVLFLVFVASYLLLFRGNSGGLDLKPLAFGRAVAPTLSPALGSVVGELGLFGMLAPLVGVAGLVAVRGWRLSATYLLPLAVFAASLFAFSVFSSPGTGELYFILYGTIAAIPVSAVGISDAWSAFPGSRRVKMRWVLAGIFAMVVAVIVGAAVLGSFGEPKPTGALVAALLLIGLACCVAGAIARYRFAAHDRRMAFVGLVIPLILFVAVLDYPIDTGSRLVTRWADGDPAWQESVPGEQNGVTRGLRDGLLWVRDHTPTSATIAVNNMYISPGFPRYFYYGAFAERPVYIEGWEYSERGFVVLNGQPLPEALVTRAQASWGAALGNQEALDALRSDGVDYLVVDKVNGQYGDTAKLDAVLKPSFSNDEVAVYDIGRR